MRAISLVDKLEFDFAGNVARDAIALGDLDNDGCFELAVGNDQGEVAIFKGKDKQQTLSVSGFVASVIIGDIRNENKNSLVVITITGWCYIFEVNSNSNTSNDNRKGSKNLNLDETDGQIQSLFTSKNITNDDRQNSDEFSDKKTSKCRLVCIHKQRISANVKCLILGDLDGDGSIEMIVGLTDRVVRSYRWFKSTTDDSSDAATIDPILEELKVLGYLKSLNKWETAHEVGSITLNHGFDGKPSLLISQPGGTFMRIRFHHNNDANLNSNDKLYSDDLCGTVDYQPLGISRMRSKQISTEILGDFCSTNANISNANAKPYAICTLDGTIMLVQDEVILWAIAVDHQTFALTKLDITKNGSDHLVVCCWDGQTYILDQNKNSVRFHLEEPVRAFDCGFYNLENNEPSVTVLVYVTFKNTIMLYYDIPLKEIILKRFEPDEEQLSKEFINKIYDTKEASSYIENMNTNTRKELIEFLLYDEKIF